MTEDKHSNKHSNKHKHSAGTREAAGNLMLGLADEISRPLSEIRDLLAGAVETLDQHAAHAKGPDPLSYRDSKAVREVVVGAYLKSASAARTASDLAAAVAGPGPVESCDLSQLIDDAVGLVRHRFSAATELFIDLGNLPSVPLAAGEFVLAVSRLLLYCADATRHAQDAAVSLRSRQVTESGRTEVQLSIAENGRGLPDDEMGPVTVLARDLADRLGGTFAAASAADAGTTFELRLPLGSR